MGNNTDMSPCNLMVPQNVYPFTHMAGQNQNYANIATLSGVEDDAEDNIVQNHDILYRVHGRRATEPFVLDVDLVDDETTGVRVISTSKRKSKSTESSPLRALKTPSWMKRIKTNNLNTTLRSSKGSNQTLLLEKIK